MEYHSLGELFLAKCDKHHGMFHLFRVQRGQGYHKSEELVWLRLEEYQTLSL